MINKISCCQNNINQNTNQNSCRNVIPTVDRKQASFGSMREINNTTNMSKFVAGLKTLLNNNSKEGSIIKAITGAVETGEIKAISSDKNGVLDFSRGNDLLIMTPATKNSGTKLAFGIPDENTGKIFKGREIEANYAPGSFLADIFGKMEESLKGLFPKNLN